MAIKKKPVSKKKANEGRPVLCRNCYIPMLKHGDLFVGWSYLCERCGLQWRGITQEAKHA